MQLPSEMAAVLGTIDPDAYAVSTVTSDWCDVGEFQQILAIVMAGELGASATLDAKLEQATDSSGTGAKDVTSSSIAQLTQAGSDSDKQALIQIRADDLDRANDFTHVRLSMSIGTATSDAGGVVLGFNPRHGPASDNDLASVDEIVTV